MSEKEPTILKTDPLVLDGGIWMVRRSWSDGTTDYWIDKNGHGFRLEPDEWWAFVKAVKEQMS